MALAPALAQWHSWSRSWQWHDGTRHAEEAVLDLQEARNEVHG